jgi:hypothetical protein
MMDENVLPAILLDKTKSLWIIKPFYCSFRHPTYSFVPGWLSLYSETEKQKNRTASRGLCDSFFCNFDYKQRLRTLQVTYPTIYSHESKFFLHSLEKNLCLSSLIRDLPSLAVRVAEGEGITEEELRSGRRTRRVSRARRLFCQVAVKKMGHPGVEVARFLGVTTSAVFRAAGGEKSSELGKYL